MNVAARGRQKSYDGEMLRLELERGELEPVYAVLGEEPLLADEILAVLREAAVPREARDFNASFYSGDDEAARQFLAQARSYPFLSERRLVVVRRFEKMSFRDPRAEAAFVEYLQAPTPSTVLVLAAAKLDRRLKLTQSIEKHARVVRAEAPPAAALPDWVRRRFAALGVQAQAAACALLVELVGDSLLDLRNEAEKVALRYGAKGSIGPDEVQATVGQYRQEEVWAINRELRADNMGGFLEALARVLEVDDDPVRIVAVLARQVNNLLRLKLLQDRGVRRGDELARKLELPPFAVTGLLSQASSFSKKQLALWLRNLQHADVQMKSLTLPSRWVLERALVNSFMGHELASSVD